MYGGQTQCMACVSFFPCCPDVELHVACPLPFYAMHFGVIIFFQFGVLLSLSSSFVSNLSEAAKTYCFDALRDLLPECFVLVNRNKSPRKN